MSNFPLKTFDSQNGKTYVHQPDQQTTAADIAILHNLIAQLLVDDYIDTHRTDNNKTTTA